VFDAGPNFALLAVRVLLRLRERMIAVRALMNPAAQAAQAELRLGLRRAIRAVRAHIRRRVGSVQKSIEFLAVMHIAVASTQDNTRDNYWFLTYFGCLKATQERRRAPERLSRVLPRNGNGPPPMKLTQPLISKLALPAGKADVIYFDDDLAGFGLRLRAGGRRSWVFQYSIGVKQRRMTLGLASAITLADARKTAGELHARVRLGADPAASRKEGRIRAADTVEATLRSYLPERKATMRPASYKCVERHLLRYAKPLHPLGLAMVTRRDVGTLLASVAAASGNVSANRTRASLSGFFAWAVARGLTEVNPILGTHVAAEQARSRVLSIEELAAVWRASGDDTYVRSSGCWF
jgi:hypothetical protein